MVVQHNLNVNSFDQTHLDSPFQLFNQHPLHACIECSQPNFPNEQNLPSSESQEFLVFHILHAPYPQQYKDIPLIPAMLYQFYGILRLEYQLDLQTGKPAASHLTLMPTWPTLMALLL